MFAYSLLNLPASSPLPNFNGHSWRMLAVLFLLDLNVCNFQVCFYPWCPFLKYLASFLLPFFLSCPHHYCLLLTRVINVALITSYSSVYRRLLVFSWFLQNSSFYWPCWLTAKLHLHFKEFLCSSFCRLVLTKRDFITPRIFPMSPVNLND